MFVKTFLITFVAIIVVVNCEWYDVSPGTPECKKQEMGDTYKPDKLSCFMGCLGKKEKWLNSNSEIDSDKFNEWIDLLASKTSISNDMKKKWKTGGENCTTAAAGLKNNCDIGDKIGECLKREGLFK